MDTLTIGECARLLGVNEQTVRRMADAGELAAVRFSDDGWRRISRQSVKELAVRRGLTLDWSLVDRGQQ